MALDNIFDQGFRFLMALDISVQVILALGGIVLGWYLIKRLTTPAERR